MKLLKHERSFYEEGIYSCESICPECNELQYFLHFYIPDHEEMTLDELQSAAETAELIAIETVVHCNLETVEKMNAQFIHTFGNKYDEIDNWS